MVTRRLRDVDSRWPTIGRRRRTILERAQPPSGLPGDVVILYVTGEGQTNPASVTGAVIVASLGSSGPVTPRPVLPVIIYIGGKTATLEFVGDAPAMAAGVLQINARVHQLERRSLVATGGDRVRQLQCRVQS